MINVGNHAAHCRMAREINDDVNNNNNNNRIAEYRVNAHEHEKNSSIKNTFRGLSRKLD